MLNIRWYSAPTIRDFRRFLRMGMRSRSVHSPGEDENPQTKFLLLNFGCTRLLARLPDFGCFAHLDEITIGHVVYVSVNWDCAWHQGMAADSQHVVNNALLKIPNGEPLDICGFVRPAAAPCVFPLPI